MKINMSPTREKYPLSQKKILKKTIGQAIGCGFFILVFFTFGGLIIASASQNLTLMLVIALGSFAIWLIFVALLYYYQKWYFATYYYEIKPDYISIKKGPITPNEINIVYQKIQDVYVDQDLLDRIMGLYDVHIATATFSSGNLAHIDGVEKDAAYGLRDELLDIFKKKVNK